MSIVNNGVNFAIMLLCVAILVVPFAKQMYDAFFPYYNSTPAVSGMTTTIVGGLITILLIVFLFAQVKKNKE